MLKSFQEIKEAIRTASMTQKVAIVTAEDKEVLMAISQARDEGLVSAILVGNEKEIRRIAEEENLSLKEFEIIHEPNENKAGLTCCQLIREKKASVIMKGLLDTSKYMKAILNKEYGLNAGRLLSHVAVFKIPLYSKLLTISDAAINIAPDLDQKADIIQNAVNFVHSLGYEKPLVACCAAVEKIKHSMQATVDAACLAKMGDRGQITGCIIDGPLAIDNAINMESVKIKKIESPVAGRADIILCNDIESANYLYKCLSFLTNSEAGAIVMGATAPVVLTSRADSHENKYFSILLGVLHALHQTKKSL